MVFHNYFNHTFIPVITPDSKKGNNGGNIIQMQK